MYIVYVHALCRGNQYDGVKWVHVSNPCFVDQWNQYRREHECDRTVNKYALVCKHVTPKQYYNEFQKSHCLPLKHKLPIIQECDPHPLFVYNTENV